MKSDISWDEIEQEMRERLKLKVDSSTRTLRIITKHKIPEGVSDPEILQGDIGLKQMTNLLLGGPVEFTMEILEDRNGVMLQFKDVDSLQRMHKFLKDLLFGKQLKKLKGLDKKMQEPIVKQEDLRRQRRDKELPERPSKPRTRPK